MADDVTRRGAVGLTVGAVTFVGAQAAGLDMKGGKAMEHAVGVGGFFFRSKDPIKLAQWYQDNLGIPRVPGNYGGPSWETEAGTTVFAPFALDSKMFGRPEQQWMINFRVRDLDKMAAQLRANGVAVEVDPTAYPNGRFASLSDPEGNPIQLWQPEDEKPG
jgi:glyoxylase I family protein